MSPFVRGLLGGVAQGVTNTASLLFQDAIAARKEERLAKIADRNYQRDRTDQLADIKSNQDFQTGLLKTEQDFSRETNRTRFGQQVALQTLGAKQQKELIKYGQQFPDTPLGKLIQERDRYEPGSDAFNQYQQQINNSQLITNTNPYTGATSIGIPIYDENNNLTDVQEVVTFGGIGSLSGPPAGGPSAGGPSAGRTQPEPPAQPEIDQDALQQRIDEVEGMQADANGMIDLGNGPVKKQDALRRLRARLTAVAPPGSTSRIGFSYMG